MIAVLRKRQEWQFFGVLPRADRPLAVAWWTVLLLRGLLPAVFAIAMGVLVGAVQRGDALAGPLVAVGRRVRAAAGARRRSTRRSAPTSATAPPPGCTTG